MRTGGDAPAPVHTEPEEHELVQLSCKEDVLPAPLRPAACQAAAAEVEEVRKVVRNIGLYYPINFRIWVRKPCKTAKFFNLLNVFPMSPFNVTAPFWEQKALKTAKSEKCVFSCPASKVRPGLQIRPFSCENLLQVFAVLRNPCSASKNLRIPARRARHRRCHRSLTRQPAEARPQSQPVSDAPARRGARQPAEAFPRDATARRARHRRSHRSLTRQPAEAPGGIEPPKRRCGEPRNA